jgi:hypothetical protein
VRGLIWGEEGGVGLVGREREPMVAAVFCRILCLSGLCAHPWLPLGVA